MTLSSKLKGAAIQALLGKTGERAFRAVDLARARIAGAPRRLDFYYDVADPWSHLAAQVTRRLVRAYGVELGIHMITPPASDVDSAPELRRRHALRDARDLAAHYDVEFPGKGDAEPNAVKRASQILIRERPPLDQLDAAIAVGEMIWASDVKGLTVLMGSLGHEAAGSIAPILNANYTELRKLGFYQGASWHWNGEWYAGIERVPYLEAALAEHTQTPTVPVLARRAALPPERLGGIKTDRPVLDVWISFRSPYSYLAVERIEELAARYPIELRVRPVLPLAMRGAAPTRAKQLYIVRDAAREAARQGIAFGAVCDPLGKGVEHALAIAYALPAPRALAFIKSAMRGSWAEALDLASYVDLRTVVERAGVGWDEAKAALAGTAWRDQAKAAVDDLALAGMWGVPSFKIGDYATWGQDRMPLLDDRLRRHFAAPAPAPEVRSDSA